MFPGLQGTAWLRSGSLNGSISQAGPTLVPASYSPPWGGDLVTQGEPGLCRVLCSVSHMFCKTEMGFPEQGPLVTLPFSVTSCWSSSKLWLAPALARAAAKSSLVRPGSHCQGADAC